MLHEKTVKVLGLEVPYFDYPLVEEREELEVLSARAAVERLADSRVKYEALRVMVKARLDKQLPVWRSPLFDEKYRQHYNESYPEIDAAITELLQPFYGEVEAKKAKRQAQAFEAAGDVKKLSAIILATELTMRPFREALKRLEESGSA